MAQPSLLLDFLGYDTSEVGAASSCGFQKGALTMHVVDPICHPSVLPRPIQKPNQKAIVFRQFSLAHPAKTTQSAARTLRCCRHKQQNRFATRPVIEQKEEPWLNHYLELADLVFPASSKVGQA
ncbi:MAG: hypothetical protein DMG61_01510 [Acidobacteria bacterium]|nr:MAG: hypothetical protein DMG61_01510 [Acidobacteriota bacterium]